MQAECNHDHKWQQAAGSSVVIYGRSVVPECSGTPASGREWTQGKEAAAIGPSYPPRRTLYCRGDERGRRSRLSCTHSSVALSLHMPIRSPVCHLSALTQLAHRDGNTGLAPARTHAHPGAHVETGKEVQYMIWARAPLRTGSATG
eukprot:CAMPEP_0115828446 /NCGR_PEP_ID=MMETSP0287-20121206/577_1 /TAXON_ID=412157 /ORGANISM="Chrysochromulina rotalis, Strain UIO044" /LENGTH=145 /DNA_ID=CAMNT_0003281661 /DNA_START=170 /DNA_END=607 /DNA_ORIENTATION=-